MRRQRLKPRALVMERLSRVNPHYAYEVAKKNLDSRANREAEVKRIAKQMRI